MDMVRIFEILRGIGSVVTAPDALWAGFAALRATGSLCPRRAREGRGSREGAIPAQQRPKS